MSDPTYMEMGAAEGKTLELKQNEAYGTHTRLQYLEVIGGASAATVRSSKSIFVIDIYVWCLRIILSMSKKVIAQWGL